MRRFVIRYLLPGAACGMPVLAALLILAVLPPEARRLYFRRVAESPIDWLILTLGSLLFVIQIVLVAWAMRWREMGFEERPDPWLSHLAQAAEWFPLLGLIGTVAAILQTFSNITPGVTPQEIIRSYAPAITATGSGLIMAFINILPTWMVILARDCVRCLAGQPYPEKNPS